MYLIIYNQIDDAALEVISKEDLSTIVPVLGHRIKIWNTIEKLRSKSVYVCFFCKIGFFSLEQLASHLTCVHQLNAKCLSVSPL